MRIDSHQHFWRYAAREYDWIDASMPVLQHDFLPPDLQRELESAGFDGSISVQARQTLEETRWLLQLAAQYPQVVRGVVGWVPLASPTVEQELLVLAQNRLLKGVRHIVQSEPDPAFLLGRDFNRGIAALLPFHLVYDILILEGQLSTASVFVDRHPHQIFVLDHLAKPNIAKHEMQPWSQHLRELAKRANVFCKLSGMVTEADRRHWQKQDLQPYIDVVLEAFGPERILFGSDWPVCLTATTYGSWVHVVEEQIRSLSESEQQAILGKTAHKVYRL